MTDETIHENSTVSATDLLAEAGALKEMSTKVQTLEAQNAELLAAKKKYYDTILNGGSVTEVVQYRTSEEIKKDLFDRDLQDISNLEYAKLALELDDACIRETGESCFLPKGKGVSPSVDERDTANRFHTLLEMAIEDSDGDNKMFNAIMSRNIK